jgi:hypothetical protein
MRGDLLRQAVSDRWKSMKRKWPAIVFAGLACYGLYYLDQVKHGFDEEKARPLVVDENFKLRLKNEFMKQGSRDDEWQEVESFIHGGEYNSADDLINKSVARISRANEPYEFVAQAAFRNCVAKALAQPVEASESNRSEPPSPVSAAEKCSTDYIAADEKSYRATQDKVANVYGFLKKAPLKKIGAELAGRQERMGFFQALLRPTLDEQSGLYIIYQILRLSLVVIIVFALISIVVLLLRTLMLGDGAKTVTDQATSFIGSGRGGLAPVGKAAVITVATLGLGTAVAAGVSINNKADQALAQNQNPPAESRRTPPEGRGTNTPSTRSTTHYDSRNTQYDYGDANNLFDYSTHQETASAATPSVVNIYPRIKVVDSGSGKGGGPTTGNLSLDPTLVTNLNSYLQSLTKANSDLVEKIKALTASPSTDEIKVANHVTKNALNEPEDKALLVSLKGQSTDSISTSLHDLDGKLKSLQDLITSLNATNLDKPANPSGRSPLRALIQPDRYFVSRRALDQIADVMNEFGAKHRQEIAGPDTASQVVDEKLLADGAISDALKSLYVSGGSPVKKKEFLNNLFAELQQTNYYKKNEQMVKGRFNFWRETILTYTRIR